MGKEIRIADWFRGIETQVRKQQGYHCITNDISGEQFSELKKWFFIRIENNGFREVIHITSKYP